MTNITGIIIMGITFIMVFSSIYLVADMVNNRIDVADKFCSNHSDGNYTGINDTFNLIECRNNTMYLNPEILQ